MTIIHVTANTPHRKQRKKNMNRKSQYTKCRIHRQVIRLLSKVREIYPETRLSRREAVCFLSATVLHQQHNRQITKVTLSVVFWNLLLIFLPGLLIATLSQGHAINCLASYVKCNYAKKTITMKITSP